MYKKKIKIFFGAYLNYENAQNLNCLALAKKLDPEKFTTYALSIYSYDKVDTRAILFNCFYPFRISSNLGFLWGIIKCDIAYLPKHISTPNWVTYLAKFLGRKVFTTIENNMCDSKKESMLNSFGSRQTLVSKFKSVQNIFGITQYIIDNANCGVRLENKVLYLGVDIDLFFPRVRKRLRNIVFVGNLIKRKKAEEILLLAKQFSDLSFFIIGDGIEYISLKSKATKNVTFLGHLNQQELSAKLSEMDLHILPSKSEGFPKVILEAAASGIPSIVYSDYGAKEWIANGENGFIINEFEQFTTTIKCLLDNKELLSKNSEGAILMAKRFDWNIVIREWESTIYNLR